ncbi:Hypothetical protein UVM_LOCUS117 [uncultured virus]|nr:Hypothetical protein UVM_LOCUS117 [uncultured virus]
MLTTRRLVISPQAGFANRLRTLCSGVVLARLLGRRPMYYWPGGEPSLPNDPAHVVDMRRCGWSVFFALPPEDERFSAATPDNVPAVDGLLSEWLPGERWYPHQCSAAKAWPSAPLLGRLGTNADLLFAKPYCDLEVLMVETSLQLTTTVSKGADVSWWEARMGEVYRELFLPQPRFRELLSAVPTVDVAVHVRRGDLLWYFEKARQSAQDIVDWLRPRIRAAGRDATTTMFLFSDDDAFRERIREELSARCNDGQQQHGLLTIVNPSEAAGENDDRKGWLDLTAHERAFAEFLCMATRVSGTVFGTPCSSFAQQAAICGSRRFVRLLAEEPPLA